MAGETNKTQAPARRQRGPMGGRGPMGRGEKPKDFTGTIRKLLGYVSRHKVAVFFAIAFAMCSVIFNIVGPKVLGKVTTKLYEGLVAKVQGTGAVDFDWIGKTLLLLLGLDLREFRLQPHPGLAHDGCHAEDLLPHAQGDRREDRRRADELLQRPQQGRRALPHHERRRHARSEPQPVRDAAHHLAHPDRRRPRDDALDQPAAHGSRRGDASRRRGHHGRHDALLSSPDFREQQQVLGAVNGVIEEDFAGQNVIQVFDRADAAVREFDEKNDRLFISGWRSQFLSGLMIPLMSLVGNAGYVAVVVVGAQLALTGNATPGDIQSFIQYVRNFTQPVQQLANVSNTMQSMAAATERVFEFLAAPRGGAGRRSADSREARRPRRVQPRQVWL